MQKMHRIIKGPVTWALNTIATQGRIKNQMTSNLLCIQPELLKTFLASPASFSGAQIDSEMQNMRSTAIISVCGALSHRPSGGFLQMLFGFSANYEQIRQNFQAALADDQVDAIMFDIDSAGGAVSGCFDLVDEIYNARGQKPIYAIANESAMSAAYAIASAADKVFIPRTASIGSIGAVALHVDRSELDKKTGVTYTAIYAGDKKNDLSPHQKLSEKAQAEIQSQVDKTYDLFVSTVARNRGISEQAVRDTQAAIYTGQDAITAGLADDIKCFNDVIDNLLTYEGGKMGLKTDLRQLLAGKSEDEIAEAMAGVKFIKEDANAVSQVNEVLSLCQVAGVNDLGFVQGLISEGLTLKQASEKILEAKADEASNSQIFSTVSALSTGEANPLLADAKRRAGGE
jgi:signal peptide peptidase SppA